MPDFDKGLNPILLNKNIKLPKLDNPATPVPTGYVGFPDLRNGVEEDPIFGKGPIVSKLLPTVSAAELYSNRRYATYDANIVDIEDQKAYAQSGWDKAANGILKGLNLTATTVAGGFGMLYGAAKAPFTGRLADIWDNDIMRGLDEWNTKVDQEYLPNYYTNVEKNAEWYSTDNWVTWNFLFDKVIKNSGFAVGAMLGGNIANAGLSKLGSLTGKVLSATATAAEASQAFKLFTPILKNTARAFSAGKNIEAAAVLEKELSSIADITERSTKLAQIASTTNKFAGFNDAARRTAIAAYGISGEAAFEALQTQTEFRNKLIEDYKLSHNGQDPQGEALQQINETSESVGKTSFLGNLALLTVTEYVQLPKLLGSSYAAEKQAANSLMGKVDDVVEKAGKYVKKEPTTRFGKIIKSVGESVKEGQLPGIARYVFDPKEAAQEIGQYALQIGSQNYFNKAYETGDANIWTDGFLYGFTGVNKEGKPVGAFVSKEGMESGLLGGLTGGLMQAKSNYQERNAKATNTQKFIEALNSTPAFKKAFVDRLNSVNRGIVLQQQQQDAVLAGDKLEAKDLQADMMHNYLSTRIKYGRFDMVMDDIDDLKKMSSSEDGLGSLKQQGIANVNDTIESFQKKLLIMEQSAKDTNELYRSLNLRYSGQMVETKDGQLKRKYSDDVVDKMVYAASKVADYDRRIPQVTTGLLEHGIDISEIEKNPEEVIKKSLEQIDSLDIISETKDVLKESLYDAAELSARRKLFLQEYDDLKKSPDKYEEVEKKQTPPSEKEGEKPSIKIKTKKGEFDFEVGEEYYLGKVVEYDEKGNEVYRSPKLTILGENEDGTIKIRDASGNIKSVDKAVFADYNLGKVSSLEKNKKAKFYHDNWNTIFEFNFGKGVKKKGRLEYSEKEGVLKFVYKDKRGKRKEIEVTGDQFVPKKGFTNAMISPIGQLTATQQQSLKEFSESQDDRTIEKRKARLQILNDLFDEFSQKYENVKSLINQKYEELEAITNQLSQVENKIKVGDLTKRHNFRKTTAQAIRTANKLSRMQDQLTREIQELESQQEEIEMVQSYVADMAASIDELPTDSSDFLEELNDQVLNLQILHEETGKNINTLSGIIKNVENALESAIKYISDLISKFETKYPNVPRIMGQDWVDFIKSNPNFLKLKPNYKTDLEAIDEEIAQVEDLDIVPNERTLSELNDELKQLQENLKEYEKEIKTKETILNKFQEVANKYKKQQEEERQLKNNQKLKQEFIGTLSNDVPNKVGDEDSDDYQPEAKKSALEVVGSTIAASYADAQKPFNQRSNRFGVRFHSIEGKERIKGVIVTAKTEDEILPGLTAKLVEGTNIPTNGVIALVMVKENVDGSYSLIDEFGNVIPKEANALDSAIFQVFPESKLTARYGDSTQTMFRDDTPEDVEQSLREQYTEWRKAILEETTLSTPQSITPSFGILKYVTYTDDKGTVKIDHDARTSVQDAKLITEGDLSEKKVIKVATNNNRISNGTVSFKTPLGRVFLVVPGGLVKLFNTKLTKAKVDVIYKAIHQLSKNALEDGSIKTDRSKVIYEWLKSVIYWGIPKDAQTKQRKEAGYNSVWVEDGKLHISGKGAEFDFTPTAIEESKELIISLLSNLYHNTNATLANDNSYDVAYQEITGFDKDGSPIMRKWDNYQTYLLSNKNPDGSKRSTEEVPLATKAKPISGDEVNREGVYFTLDSTPENFTIKQPEIKQKAPEEVKKETAPEKPKESSLQTEYDLSGETDNTMKLGSFGDVDFRFNIEEYIASEGKRGLSITVTEATKNFIENLKASDKYKNKTKEELDVIILSSVFSKLKPIIEAYEMPVDKSTEAAPEPKDSAFRNRERATSKDDEDSAYRLAVINQSKKFTREDWVKLEKFLKEKFPNIPVHRVQNVIRATNGRQAWGMLQDGAIYLYENAEVGTGYHEVFEAVWKMFTSVEERNQIIDEFRSRKGEYTDPFSLKTIKYSEATPQDIKEKLAEEFREQMLSGKYDKKSFLSRVFEDIINFFKTFFFGKQAASNTQSLFDKIGNGYFRDYVPYESALSYAKRGIIDIEDVIAKDGSDFSLVKIPSEQLHEIMQHMTYTVLTSLTRNDKSLFSIPKINKKETYDNLKEEILTNKIGRQGTIIEEAIANKEITQKEAQPKYQAIEELYNAVYAQWDEIVKKHEEYLKAYSVQFDENDDSINYAEDKTGKEDWIDTRKVDIFRKASGAVKLLLATTPYVYSDKGQVKIVKSSIGGVKLLPSDKVFITLKNTLHDAVNLDDMMIKFRDLALKDINYQTLYRRILKTAPNLPFSGYADLKNEHDWQLISAFWKVMKAQSPDVKTVFVLGSGEVIVGDTSLAKAAGRMRYDMFNSLASAIRTGANPYMSYDKKEKEYTANTALSKVKLDPSSPKSYLDFLSKIGVDFSEKDYTTISKSDDKLANFIDAVNGIKASFEKMKGVKSINKNSMDVEGRLMQLATLKAAIENPEFESTYFNLNGDRVQSYLYPNAPSALHNVISQIKKLTPESLQNTGYEYLLTDVFSKNSVVLQKIFNISKGTFKRKENTEDILSVGYVDGTINEQNGKKKESSKLSQKQRFIQEINLNLKGWYYNLVPGDASIEWMIKLHKDNSPFVSEDSIASGWDEVFDIFKGYFLSEVELSRDGRKIANVKGRKSTDLRFFKEMLPESVHSQIVKNTTVSSEELYEQFKKEINTAVKQFIEEKASNLEDTLRKYGIIEATEEGISMSQLSFAENKDLSNEDVKRYMKLLSANYAIANIELHKLIYSDPYQYKDELKRIKNFSSPRQPLIHGSAEANASINSVYNKHYSKDDVGHTDFTKDFLVSSEISDIFSSAELSGYEKPFEETDGGGYVSLKAYRNIRLRAGDWSEAEEGQYQYDVAYWKNIKYSKQLTDFDREILKKGNPQVQSAYTTLKPIVSGNKKDGDNFNSVVLDKFALVPLSFRIIHQLDNQSNMLKLIDKMENQKVDYVVYSTGRKVGGGEPTPLYISNGEFNSQPFVKTTNIPFSIIGIQAEVPSKEEAKVTRGSQMTKLVTMDYMNAGVPIDYNFKGDEGARFAKWITLTEEEKIAASPLYKEILNNQRLLEETIKEGYNTLLEKLGLEETVDGFKLTSKEKISSTLAEEILKRETNDNIIDAIAGFKNGDVILEATPAYHQIRNILFSIADKNVVSPKISGGQKVQIPSTLLEQHREIRKDGKAYVSDVLEFYKNEEGKMVCEVMIGRWFDNEVTKKMSDEELLEYLNKPENQSILGGIGFRIPTQKQNSIDVFKIKKFLPKEFGDNVVIPSALVKKVGSDFDIDKLSVYLKNVFFNNKGLPEAVPYYGIGEQAKKLIAEKFDKGEFLSKEELKELDRIIEEERDALFTVERDEEGNFIEDSSQKLFRDLFSDVYSEEAITKDFVKSITKEGFRKSFINKMYKKSLENAYISSLESLVSNPLNFERLTIPNSAEEMKDLANNIVKATKQTTFDYSAVGNMLDRTFMSSLRHAFVTGKYAIGIAAVAQTNHAQNQRTVIYLDDSKINPEDKEWLGDGKIKFEKYNSLIINEKRVPTLSLSKNADDKYISDIIGMFIDGYVDISKGPWIMQLGATPNVASTWLFLIKLGVPVETVAYFMNQPIIRDYLRNIESSGYSWLFIDSFVENTKAEYSPGVEMQEETVIPSRTVLEKMLGKSTSELTDEQKNQQQFILGEFLKYAKMAEQLFTVTQASNYDTATINDSFIIFKKQMQLEAARKTMLSSIDSETKQEIPGVDGLLKSSFVGYLKDKIFKIRDAFSEILVSDKTSSSVGTSSTREVLEATLLPYIHLSDNDFVKVARKAVSDLFDWVVQTNQGYNSQIADVLFEKEDRHSVARRVMNFAEKVKKDENHPLNKNVIINSFRLIPGSKENTPDNLEILGKANKMYDQNQIIYGFRELRDGLVGEEKKLYDDILKLTVIQSGLSTSHISFTSLIPYEDFKKIYNESLSVIEKIPNLADFYKLNVFQRNNFSDDDVTPSKRAKLIKLKKPIVNFYTGMSKQWVIPELEFVNSKLKAAENNGKISKVIQLTPSRDTEHDVISYTWEKPLSKDKKNEMRKKGDYSYIQKSLFKKVYRSDGTPLMTSYTNKAGKTTTSYVYKAINAWGDSFRANEFYTDARPSVIDNGYMKIEKETPDSVIENIIYPENASVAAQLPTADEATLRSQIAVLEQKLKTTGLSSAENRQLNSLQAELGKIIKSMC